MAGPGRKELLCEQTPPVLTGIDFVLVDPTDHRRLSIFFVVDPDQVTRPVDQTATEMTATIIGLEDGEEIAVAGYSWDAVIDAAGDPRLTLTVLAEVEGGFQNYELTLMDEPGDAGPSRLDRFCATLLFSFKQPCPSPFDCKPVKDCPDEPLLDYAVDYLARDFESFRQALLTFASERYPDWDAAVPADFGGMAAELFSALGDEFSYIQDRFQREGYLATLTQRRSFNQVARLVDFQLDPGAAAEGLIVVRLYEGAARPLGLAEAILQAPAGLRVWAYQGDGPPIPFEIGEDLSGMIAGSPEYDLHTHWTDMPAYVPDDRTPCLPVGAREMYVNASGLLSLVAPAEAVAGMIGEYWIGRRLLIETRPIEPEAPPRRRVVVLDEAVEAFPDPLTGATDVVRIHWRAEDALPFELDQTQAFISANLVPVRAGMTICEPFAIGPGDGALPPTVQRDGPARDGARPAIHRFTLSRSVDMGLGWRARRDDAGVVTYEPDVALVQQVSAGAPIEWSVSANSLDFAATDEAASVEPGRWAPVARFERRGVPIVHYDYAGDAGYTVRFGDGLFARQPSVGDIFEAFYRTGPGRAGNVPADTITETDDPPGAPPAKQMVPPLPAGASFRVRNPFALTGGKDPQSLDLARRIAPAAYKAITFRAVRDEDYRAQAERLDWVEQAGAITRWTGAWASTFVSADPMGAFEISDERFAELEARLGAVRQVGRCVIARQPVFTPLDLKIAICVAPGFAFGDVAERIVRALSPAADGFFSPDRFSYGDPLLRPSLEAAIACVAGVLAVREIQIRERGVRDFRVFDVPELAVADNRILKVENDPNRPGQGSIRVYDEIIPEMAGV